MNELEIWKSIKDYEGLYEVSNLGRVKSLKGKKERILNASISNNGYYSVALRKNNKEKRYTVHRLVALTFISNPNKFPIINHKDENKSNNRVENLEWCSYKYNLNYGNAQNKRREWIKNNRPKKIKPFKTQEEINLQREKTKQKNNSYGISKVVQQYNLNGELIKEWDSVNKVKEENYNTAAVCLCCQNKFNRLGNNKYKSFVWKYKNIS